MATEHLFSSLPPSLPPNSLIPLDERHDLGPVEQVRWGRLVILHLKLLAKSLPPKTVWETLEQLKRKRAEGGEKEGGRKRGEGGKEGGKERGGTREQGREGGREQGREGRREGGQGNKEEREGGRGREGRREGG